MVLIGVKNWDFLEGHPSQYYSSLRVLNYKVFSMVKPKDCNPICNSKMTQLNLDSNITIWLAVEIISYLLIDEVKGISNEWFIRNNTWWRFFKWGCKKSGYNHGGNSIVKHAQDGVVLGFVTSRKVLMLHLYEHHLDLMSANCSIYSHKRWIRVELVLMKHGSMSLNQKSQS